MLEWIAPALCVACGADAGRAAPLCRGCRAAMRPLAPAHAHGSATQGSATQGSATQGSATQGSATQGSATPWGAFAYEGPAGAIVRALKFEGRRGLADLIAAQLIAAAPPGYIRGAVVPVPVHPAHRRRRGVDHTGAIAAALAQRARLPLANCLERTGTSRTQVGRARRERIQGPLGEIRLRANHAAPAAALVVDDVLTTGATLTACIRALHANGCGQISALAYALTTAR